MMSADGKRQETFHAGQWALPDLMHQITELHQIKDITHSANSFTSQAHEQWRRYAHLHAWQGSFEVSALFCDTTR
jgi:hypothetical protein